MGFVAPRRGAVRGTEGTARPLLHMLPLSPEFYFLCLRSLRVPAPWGSCPRASCWFSLCPVLLHWVLAQPLPWCCTGQVQSRMCLAALG